ncbi:hypothetical protein BWK47_13620 [Synechocystis sp. CACIAM 05]|nr:hypothetical protein BWK47_13620 [Synechocystis sp. CACIAM 05]
MVFNQHITQNIDVNSKLFWQNNDMVKKANLLQGWKLGTKKIPPFVIKGKSLNWQSLDRKWKLVKF